MAIYYDSKPVEVDTTFDPTSENAVSGVAVKEAIDEAVQSMYKPGGSILFSNLPVLSADVLGFVYNITDAFTTDARFVESAGTECAAGTNVVVVNTGTEQNPVYKFDILAAGAVQVQSDWTQTDTSAVDYIKNKPTIPTVNDATLTISQNGVLKGVFTANSSTNVDVLLENLPADFITNQNSAQTATTPLKVWEGTSSDYADQIASTGTFYAWDMSSGGWTGYTMEYPITNSSVIYWYSAGEYGPTSNTIIYTNGTTSFVRDDYEEFRYAPEKNIGGSNIGPDTICFVEGVGVKIGNTLIADSTDTSGLQPLLTAGTGIDITSNTISVTSPVLTNTATGSQSLSINSVASSEAQTVGVGYIARNTGRQSVAVGYAAMASGEGAVAIGRYTSAYTNSIAIGNLAQTGGEGTIQIGGFANGMGVSYDDNKMFVGSTGNDNWELLNRTTGKIPDARLSTNVQTKSNLVTSVSSSSTDSQYPSAKLLYDTVGNIEATLDAIIAQGSNS